jgi:hypothetical protein
MKVKGLNGRIYAWRLQDKLPRADDPRKRSDYHKRARALLHQLFPLENIYEEVYLPGCDKLYADFVIPTRKMIVEVHGEQHYHFVSFYYTTILDFIEAKKRDNRKRQWAELNSLTLVELPYDEDIKLWQQRIIQT